MAFPLVGVALGFLGKYKWPLVILGVVLYSGTLSGWSYMKGREAILEDFAEERAAQYEKGLELAARENKLNRELAERATRREVAQEAKTENVDDWRKYVEANPDVGCTVVDDDGLQYIQGIFEAR